MKRVDWKPRRPKDYAYANVGNILLKCHSYTTLGGNRVWYGGVSLSVGRFSAIRRQGKRRCSLLKAQDDAIRLAREILDDHQIAIDIEAKNFA